jgi:hypothetical protein
MNLGKRENLLNAGPANAAQVGIKLCTLSFTL